VLKSNGSLLPKRAVTAIERTRGNVTGLRRSVERLSATLAADVRALEQAGAALDQEIRRVRMLPFAGACEGLERVVRDLARAGGKEVELAIEGGEVQIGRLVLEGLKDSLLHLVRNSVDHGIEAPDERRALGKPARATVRVTAALRGNSVEIVVADDGRGLDMAVIRDRARQRGVKSPDDDREAAQLVFLPGFSTAALVTELSGRGVGLDIVKHAVETLQGQVHLMSETGRGTRAVLMVPLTLATIRAVLVKAAGQLFALPTMHVERLTRANAADLASVEGRDVLLSLGTPVRVALLADVLGLQDAPLPRPADKALLVVLRSGANQVAFVVEELFAEHEIVVKSLGRRIRRVPHVSGATVLPTGQVALILNASGLVRTALGRVPRRVVAPAPEAPASGTRRRVLLVEDSVTTRSLEKSILEAAGYDVLTAADGAEGWRLLQERGADVVVTDVEMPRMDGFSLCETIRASKRFRDLPVVLVTALEHDRDKERGLNAGADAYLPKTAFDQRRLLDTIAQLL
jgi:two-component system chemotaxis sensor kinase CheA